MFRRIDDFLDAWTSHTGATLKVLRALTQASLEQPVHPGGRTLGRIAWHITLTLPEMMGHAGLAVAGPDEHAPRPPLPDLIAAYESGARAVAEAVKARWTDAMLEERIPMYGETWARGEVLTSLIVHEAHHRGQMTVLMRQAGLAVPGVYGPAAEEWAAMGMPAQP